MSATAETAEALLDELRAAGVDVAAVEDLHRLSGGASRETWAFDLVDGEGAVTPRILQRTRPGTVGSMPMVAEAGLLRAAIGAGVPAPAVVACGDGSGPLGGGWVVVSRIDGETIARRILRDDEFGEARRVVVGQAGEALAAVHRIPPDAVPGLSAVEPLGQLRSLVDLLGEPHPAIELGFRWLEAHRPPVVPPVVVHGDFRLGNLVVGADGLRAVLDWELAHVGDPMEDLGWFCARAWRFGGAAPVAGLGTYEALHSAYEEASGRPVDRDAARWWEMAGCLRWAAICMLQASAHLSGVSRSVELAAIGRRTCEAEYDLLLGLRSAWGSDEPSPVVDLPQVPAGPGLHDAPTITQLVEAVREFVAGDVMDATEGRVRFHARVAANVLSMVERELDLGPGQERAHAARLASLGVADDGELAALLRSGSFDGRLPEVGAVVWAAVLDKVRVANPAYLVAADREGRR